MPPTDVVAAIRAATESLTRAAESMSAAQWSAPSLLPDWSRADVLAHVTLNAEAVAGVLETGGAQPMYAAEEARNADIADLAAAAQSTVLARFGDSAERVATALARLPMSGVARRLPSGPEIELNTLLYLRWGEVEIHHADLGLGFTAHNWSRDFADHIFTRIVTERQGAADLTLTHEGGTTNLGAGGPTLSGSRTDLAWWLLGRGAGEGLTGPRPELGRSFGWGP